MATSRSRDHASGTSPIMMPIMDAIHCIPIGCGPVVPTMPVGRRARGRGAHV